MQKIKYKFLIAILLITSSCYSQSVSVSIAAMVNSVVADRDTICQGSTEIYLATPTNGGTSPIYQWQVNGVNVGGNSILFSYSPQDGDNVTCILTSSLAGATNNPDTSNTLHIVVIPSQTISVSFSVDKNNICAGSLVTVTPDNPTYYSDFFINGLFAATRNNWFQYVPYNGDKIYCVYTTDYNKNKTCVTGKSSTITMVVNSRQTASVSIAANPAGSIVAGTSVTFTAAPTNGGSAPVYQWKVNGSNVGTNAPTYSYIPANNDIVSCVLTSSNSCAANNQAISNSLTMMVLSNTGVSVSIANYTLNGKAISDTICQGAWVYYKATPTNGGTSPSYQWQVNGLNVGLNEPIFEYIPLDGDIVICKLTSNLANATNNPATSNFKRMVVFPSQNISVPITEDKNNICAGTRVNITTGKPYQIEWYLNGVLFAADYMSIGGVLYNNNDKIYCVYTSEFNKNNTCVAGKSNTITMIVNPNVMASVSIEATPAGVICVGNSVTVGATPTNGDYAPTYQWKVNGLNVGTNAPTYSYIPENNDVVSCVLSSRNSCASNNPATSNAINMMVLSTAVASVSIAENKNTICQGTSVQYTATQTNGGGSPAYQWKVNGLNAVTNSPMFSYVPVNNDVVSCILTSSNSCASGNPSTSNAVTMTVNPLLPVGVSIVASPGTSILEGESIIFSASATNGGTTPAYQWQVNGSNVGTNNPDYTNSTLNNGDIVTCIFASNFNSICITDNPATSNVLTINVMANTVKNETEFQLPNAFIPNKEGPSGGLYTQGDHNNNIFRPVMKYYDLENYQMLVFNRWGNLVFESNNLNLGWDGYYKGKLCMQGVYIWKIKYTLKNQQTMTHTGNVTLIQ